MPEPRIWFDPPAFSWGRVIRIGVLWLALVLVLLTPLLMTVDEERRPPAGEPLPLRVARVAPAAVAPSARPAPSAAMSRPRPVADAPAATAAKPASAVPAARTVEACGGTRITLSRWK